MSTFRDYQDRFTRIEMRREDGILEFRMHTDGGPLRWGPIVHEELGLAFRAIAQDPGRCPSSPC